MRNQGTILEVGIGWRLAPRYHLAVAEKAAGRIGFGDRGLRIGTPCCQLDFMVWFRIVLLNHSVPGEDGIA